MGWGIFFTVVLLLAVLPLGVFLCYDEQKERRCLYAEDTPFGR